MINVFVANFLEIMLDHMLEKYVLQMFDIVAIYLVSSTTDIDYWLSNFFVTVYLWCTDSLENA